MGENTEKDEIDDIVAMIDGKMAGGVSRLSIGFSEELETGIKKEVHHHGRCDVGSPWAKGTVSNCDVLDRSTE